jgi:hypothetical protein
MKAMGLQPCIVCCLDRQFAGAEAVTRRYEIQSLVCPGCDSVIRLVQKRAAATHRSSSPRRPICAPPLRA